jgi:hypothetical protein
MNLRFALLLLSLSGCTAQGDRSTETDGKFAIWCVGACMSIVDRSEGEDNEVIIHPDDELIEHVVDSTELPVRDGS